MVDGFVEKNAVSVHHIEFTMDDFVTHRGAYKDRSGWKDYETKTFYISDNGSNGSNVSEKNNADLAPASIKENVVSKLEEMRKEVIVNSVVREFTYAVNKNNSYARSAGITYNFEFPTTSTEDMYSSIENIGFLAFVQGINVGNKYLNTKAYAITSIELATRYYLSVSVNGSNSKYGYNLYHRDVNCPEYISSFIKKRSGSSGSDSDAIITKITPRYVLKKQEATSTQAKVVYKNGSEDLYQGFYPCPICNP